MSSQTIGARVSRLFLLAVLGLLTALTASAQEVGTLTLLSASPLRVIRGASVLQGAEGLRLHQGDILETGSAAGAQAQLEFAGGAVVELGPSSQLYLFSVSGSAAELVLLTGWLKGETTGGVYRYSTPLITATSRGGNVLLHATGDTAEVFVERGTASVNGGAIIASSAERVFFTRRAGKPVTATAPPPPRSFVEAMPISFRDVLPPRASSFAGKKPPVPKPDHEVSYAEVERWLMLPLPWRRGFAARFKPRLQDSAFRQAIEAHLSSLPDWGPVLHPDNTKAGPAAAGKPSL